MGTLKDLRILVGLTQEEVAYKVGVSSLTYRRWEYGSAIPNAKYVAPLAEVLSCGTDDILEVFK